MKITLLVELQILLPILMKTDRLADGPSVKYTLARRTCAVLKNRQWDGIVEFNVPHDTV